ncbi:hypothetical protein F4604DRAFT_1928815 [Suillus subluteus]|nr:hypothetical protein F4604DRAFT_1928815 [Suillus subluteus]
MHANSSENKVSTLKKENRALEQKIIKLEQQVISLEGKLEISSSRYKQLLERIGSLGISTPTDPFTEMLKMACETNIQIPVHCEDDYDGVYYWFKSDWTKEYQGGRGVLKVKRPDGAGSTSYLVNEDGFVALEAIQQKMCETLHTLWFTLLGFGCAPTSWTKIDILALEFVRLSMQKAFVHFRLCDSDWKTDQFAIRHYPQWMHRPKELGDTGTQEKVIKQESSHEMLVHTVSAKSKRLQSITISPSTRHPKKKKEDHETPDDNDRPLAPSQSTLASTALRAIKIINPLTGLFKTKSETPSGIIPTGVTSPATAFSSTNDLIAHMVTASMNDIDDVAVPLTIEAKHSFIQLLSNSILATKDTTTHTTPNAAVAITADFDADSTKATKKNFKKNPNATKETNGRATAKSLCAIDWVESNVGGTNAAFKNYWRKLDKEEKKKYHNRVALIKTAKACAVASPIVGAVVMGPPDEIPTSS